MDMGIDSILGIEWINILKKKYQWEIDITALYDFPTVQELAGFINSIKIEKTEKKVNDKLDLDQLLEQVYEGKLTLSDAEGCIERMNLDII